MLSKPEPSLFSLKNWKEGKGGKKGYIFFPFSPRFFLPLNSHQSPNSSKPSITHSWQARSVSRMMSKRGKGNSRKCFFFFPFFHALFLRPPSLEPVLTVSQHAQIVHFICISPNNQGENLIPSESKKKKCEGDTSPPHPAPPKSILIPTFLGKKKKKIRNSKILFSQSLWGVGWPVMNYMGGVEKNKGEVVVWSWL